MRTMKHLVLATAATAFSAQVFGAGFEKSNLWSGKYMGRGGAATSSVEGSESMYFNPARLTTTDQTHLSLNFSPTYSKFEAPIGGTKYTSEQTMSPVFGATFAKRLSDKAVMGLGYYIGGGTNVKYTKVAPGAFDYYTNLALTEAAAGLAYQLSDTLSVGVAWRLSMVDAKLKMFAPVGPPGTTFEMKDGKATEYGGYRLGLSYNPSKDWGLGVSYRSKVAFDIKGKGSLSVPVPVGDVNLLSQLPQQINIGTNIKLAEYNELFLDYSWTEYSAVKSIAIKGIAAAPNAAIDAKWKDQHVARIGYEYSGMAMPLRLGYAFTSKVVPASTALPTLSTPGDGHSMTLGTSVRVAGSFAIDGAVEYSMVNGKGSSSTSTGDMKSVAFPVVHLGTSFNF